MFVGRTVDGPLQHAARRQRPPSFEDGRSDLLCSLLHGVYADLDIRLLRPLAPILEKHKSGVIAIIAEEPFEHSVLADGLKPRVCNAILISSPKHPFWLHVINAIYHEKAFFADPVDTTGPRFLEPHVKSWRRTRNSSKLMRAPPDLFYPKWDPIQEDTLRQKCFEVDVDAWTGPTGPSASLYERLSAIEWRVWQRRKKQVCARLVKDEFKPAFHGSPFTDHMWAHTWIDGLQKA